MATTLDPHLRWLVSMALAAGACAKETPETERPEASDPPVEEPQTTPGEPETAPEEPPGEALPQPPPGGGATCGSLVEGLQPASPVDGVVLIEDRAKMAGYPAEQDPQVEYARSGTPCRTAGDPQACEGALSEPPADAALHGQCGQMGCVSWVLGYTAADKVAWVASPEALRAFLGPIDTPAEARLIAWQAGYSASCEATTADGGYTLPAQKMLSDCPITNGIYVLKVASDGTITELEETVEETSACVGRLPPGLVALPQPAAETDAAAAWLARIAHLEASAVHAFAALARELEVHGAPPTLIAAARSAQADEVRHAELVGGLARRLGAEVAPAVVEEVPVRSLEAIALDNAAEGLCRETWGAVVGRWQAAHAELPEVRALMAEIAEDELRHAEFSRALHTWLESQLDRASLDRAEQARRQAWARMLAGVRPANATSRALGLPTGAVAEAMLAVVAA